MTYQLKSYGKLKVVVRKKAVGRHAAKEVDVVAVLDSTSPQKLETHEYKEQMLV